MNHPTTTGADGERSEPLHPCPRWAELLSFGGELPVAGDPTHAERITHQPKCHVSDYRYLLDPVL